MSTNDGDGTFPCGNNTSISRSKFPKFHLTAPFTKKLANFGQFNTSKLGSRRIRQDSITSVISWRKLQGFYQFLGRGARGTVAASRASQLPCSSLPIRG